MNPPSISVTQPVGQALERVKMVLFRPFDAAKWFTIGFCAWLALLGRRSFNFNFGSNYGRSHRVDADQVRNGIWRARDYVLAHLYWIIPVALAVLAFGLTVWVCFTWLNSRGAFMFLHCVARNRADVAEPWRRYRREGNSLFGFRLGLGLLSLAVTVPLMLLAGWQILRMFLDDAWAAQGIWTAVGFGTTGLICALLLGLVGKLTNDFAIPLMFRRETGWRAAWAGLWRLLSAHPGEFILYLLFQIVLGVAIVVVILTAVVVTCCLAGCLLVLPYLGTVLLLPVLVFSRSYSLYYLAQFGPECDAFGVPEPPVAGGGVSPPP